MTIPIRGESLRYLGLTTEGQYLFNALSEFQALVSAEDTDFKAQLMFEEIWGYWAGIVAGNKSCVTVVQNYVDRIAGRVGSPSINTKAFEITVLLDDFSDKMDSYKVLPTQGTSP